MNDYTQAFVCDGMVLEACEYKDRISATTVINTQTLSNSIYIHLPVECVHLDLLRLAEFKKPKNEIEVTDDDATPGNDGIHKYKDHPWVKIKSSILDWTPGNHIYKLSFGMPHEVNPDYLDYYISYISQEDNPDKAYVYMKR